MSLDIWSITIAASAYVFFGMCAVAACEIIENASSPWYVRLFLAASWPALVVISVFVKLFED